MPARRLRPTDARSAYRLLAASAILVLVLMAAYVGVRLTTVVAEGQALPDRVMAFLLLGAELFLLVHGVGFFGSVLKASGQAVADPPPLFSRPSAAPVAVLVMAYNEAEEVLEQTLASALAMDYPSARIYLLDDSTRPECYQGAVRLAEKYGIELVHRTDRSGYKAGAMNDLIPRLSEPYLAVLDADQRPLQSWLKDVVPYLEDDPGLALVQVPQVYVGTEGLPVAEAARCQQAVFFEYICEGKSASNAMFCCGSNSVLRREALLSVETVVDGRRHFFDETSVTEDFATSIRLHARGWRTAYLNRTYVVGMGPETLPAYFTQQMRWAMGTLGVGLRALGQLLSRPRQLAPAQWWEYLLSGTYYFVGFANFVFMLAPVAFVAFGLRPLWTHTHVYLVAFICYFAFTMNLFYFGMTLRGYSVRGMWLASALSFSTFWTYMKAGLVALFGLKRAFGVTPKGVGGALPLRSLSLELVMFLANAAAAAAGVAHLLLTGVDVAWVVNTIWAAYHAILLSTLFFHFNRRVVIAGRQLLFEPAERAA